MNSLEEKIIELESQLKEARELAELYYKNLTKRVLTCVYCGIEYSDEANHDSERGRLILTSHIEQCQQHPLYKTRMELAETQKLLKEQLIKIKNCKCKEVQNEK